MHGYQVLGISSVVRINRNLKNEMIECMDDCSSSVLIATGPKLFSTCTQYVA